MKKKIHPPYFKEAIIECACGNILKTGSTREKMSVEICGACHPFYTGKKKILDATGRVDRFNRRMAKTAQIKSARVRKKPTKKVEKTEITLEK